MLDESTHQPIDNAHIELVQTDQKGSYFDEQSMWNPRLFCYLITQPNGQFSINTIMSGRYSDDNGDEVPAHIHFTLEADGYRMYSSEFTFEDDPIFKVNGNIDDVPVASLSKENRQDSYEVTLFMQKERDKH